MLVKQIVNLANDIASCMGVIDVTEETVVSYINGNLPEVVWNDALTLAEANDPDSVDGVPVYALLPPEDKVAAEVIYAAVRACRFYITDGVKPVIPDQILQFTDKQKKEWEADNDFKLPSKAKTEVKVS